MEQMKPLYLSLLEKTFSERIQNEAHYSLRRFAQFLKVDAADLSRILNRKQSPSLKMGRRLVQSLGLSHDDRKAFLMSIIEERTQAQVNRITEELSHV